MRSEPLRIAGDCDQAEYGTAPRTLKRRSNTAARAGRGPRVAVWLILGAAILSIVGAQPVAGGPACKPNCSGRE